MTLHVYGQPFHHSDAYLLGTPDDLRVLAGAINLALAKGVGCMDTFTDDGEGYTLSVICADDATMEKARLPYYDEMATDTRPHVLNPWQVLPPNTEIPGEK